MAKILIVEDDKLIRAGLVDLLRTETDHQVIEAEDGESGLELALKQQPALIITDLHMPKKTGTEMIADIRQDSWGKDVPIIIMSNDEATSTINDALEAGVTVYLSKVNVDRTALLQQISTML